jgi:AcrR family transcriptional regulator
MLSEEKPRFRDPERTRERLLQAGFREVYRSGFQSASIDTILAATNVTKGALYHHFDSKEDLGHAIIEEIVAKLTQDKWIGPLQQGKNPIDTLISIVQATSVRPADVKGVAHFSIWRRKCLRWTNNSASDWKGSSANGSKELRQRCGGGSPREQSAATCTQKTLRAF